MSLRFLVMKMPMMLPDMNSHHRPLRDQLDLDFPDRKRKPMSTPYGPYADDFSLEQHKYGPYPPIAEYYKEVYQMTKKK